MEMAHVFIQTTQNQTLIDVYSSKICVCVAYNTALSLMTKDTDTDGQKRGHQPNNLL